MFTLVKALSSDLPFLVDLRLNTMDEHMKNQGLYLSVDEHKERVLFQFHYFHLVKHDNVVIGAVKYEDFESLTYIHQIQVRPEYQGRGYGRQILELIMHQSPFDVFELKVLKNNPAFKLYRELGFSVVEEDEFEYRLRLTKDSKNLDEV